ncbi:MAG: hypothetical protein IT270_05890 [Saprospiraceae bacterium]|nr:hypothetical protein [Saprospiraceae bacterium]
MEHYPNYASIDEAFLPFHAFATALSEFDGEITDEESGTTMSLSEVRLELPILIDIASDENETLTLGASPPLYYVATGIESVFHKITLRVTLLEKENT